MCTSICNFSDVFALRQRFGHTYTQRVMLHTFVVAYTYRIVLLVVGLDSICPPPLLSPPPPPPFPHCPRLSHNISHAFTYTLTLVGLLWLLLQLLLLLTHSCHILSICISYTHIYIAKQGIYYYCTYTDTETQTTGWPDHPISPYRWCMLSSQKPLHLIQT